MIKGNFFILFSSKMFYPAYGAARIIPPSIIFSSISPAPLFTIAVIKKEGKTTYKLVRSEKLGVRSGRLLCGVGA
jgi:hypothetical protein